MAILEPNQKIPKKFQTDFFFQATSPIYFTRYNIMKQRTTRRNDSLQFLTKPYYNCIYLLSIACILNGLILEAYAKAPLHISGWQFPSQFDQVIFLL